MSILVSGICSGVVGYYIWTTLNIPFEVKEPIEILQYPSQLSLYSGENLDFNVTLLNHASINYSVVLNFTLSNTTFQESFVTFSSEIYKVVPSQQNLTAWIEVEASAPPMNLTLSVDFTRGAYPSYPSGLVGYWKFDEGNGTIAFDSSSNDNHGLLMNGPTWVSGRYGTALSLNGTSYVNCGSERILDITDAITIEAWIYKRSNSLKGGTILWKDNYVLMGEGGGISGFRVVWSDHTQTNLEDFTVPLNEWVHYVATYDGSYMRVYLNGTLLQETYANKKIAVSSTDLVIGSDLVYHQGFNGIVDDVQLYNRALSEEEVLAHFLLPPP